MGKICILIIMIFLHILDDFCMQPMGFLASGKQKEWWKKNAPEEMYRFDYLVVMFFHCFSWAFMIMLPLFVYCFIFGGMCYPLLFVGNIVIHFVVDDMKANKRRINLVQDQLAHILQIIITWALWFYIY